MCGRLIKTYLAAMGMFREGTEALPYRDTVTDTP